MAAKLKSSVFTFLFLILINGNYLWAQTYGKIVGIVSDGQTDETLIGANVYLEGTSLGAATDLDGNYIILKIPPGKYRVTVEYLGYQKLTYENVEVLTDLTTTLNFKINPEVIEGEEIVVVALPRITVRRSRSGSGRRGGLGPTVCIGCRISHFRCF